MHGVGLSNMEYVEKSTVELPVFAKASKEETSAPALDQNVEMLNPEEKCRQESPAFSSIKSKAPQEEPRDLSLKRPWQLWPI